MKNGSENGKSLCTQMPDILAAIQAEVFSEEKLAAIPQDECADLMSAIAKIEGSNDKEMTCIAKEDYPRVIQAVRRAIATKKLTSDSPYDLYAKAVAKRLHGSLRSMNKHCDECLREACERQSELTREQIKEASQPGAPLSSRGSKIAQQLPDEATSVFSLSDLELANESA